ncbi:DEAD/DEAH box helicase [Kitasatospora indigofera]|uniref:DEAD/DEAH box helicase n=1 Tax=Kitasatospora indigofera TaxID=67307 RepID=UPI0036A90301
MRPTLEARALKESLLQYLSTTYALTDEGARLALHSFLGDESTGMFRGPFLRIRTPFIQAGPDWRRSLEWAPGDGWTPYAHQARAFARLSSAGGHVPEPTMVTTGTGSGKTESFLIPVLDHCRREKAAGRRGVKAVLLYPMNALATDQALRINDYLRDNDEALTGVTAGLYIGDVSKTRYERVETNRAAMQTSPPDILITNYKMLDLLLQRSDDAPLWAGADLRYVVVDEFHTFDGAQGTDVAMLLRRLASALGVSEPTRPLGPICPVATSATLSSDAGPDSAEAMLRVASEVFGTPFTADAVVGEQRLTPEEFIPSESIQLLPVPTPEKLATMPDPALNEEAFQALAEAFTGERDLDPFALGARLKTHILTQAVMLALGGELKSVDEILAVLWRAGAYSWGQAITQRPEQAAEALARFVALLSTARDPESTAEQPRPLVQIEVHQWARSVSRVLRGVLPWPKAQFQWDAGDAPQEGGPAGAPSAPVTTATSGEAANLFLPAVYCRDCGRSGWAVFTPESDDLEVEVTPAKIRRASTSQDRIRVRNLIAATDEEARRASATAPVPASARDSRGGQLHGAGGDLMVLDGTRRRLRLPDPAADFDPATGEPRVGTPDSAFVLVNRGATANTAAKEDWCPACGERNAVRYLGTGQAALAAASITRLFTGGELDEKAGERKTLMFNDSVQDAAHRAGFVANRSYTFSLRALLVSHLSEQRPTALNDLIAEVIADSTVADTPTAVDTLAAVVPPDLHDLRGVARLLSGKSRGGDRPTWELIGERLAFQTLMEFGLRARQGRTLELTRTAAAHVRLSDPAAAAALVREAHLSSVRADTLEPVPDTRYLAFLRIFLERLRWRGAIKHRWLEQYLSETGTSRYFVWGRRPQGMPAFPKGVAAPVFLLSGPKDGSEFDVVTGRLAWHERWAGRTLGVPREQSPAFWGALLPALHGAGLLSVRTAKDGATRIHGLQPGAIDALLLSDEDVESAYVRCRVCFWEQTVHPSLLEQWHDAPCPSYRCSTGRLVAGTHARETDVHARDRQYRDDYYRRLYHRAGPYQVVTAEHTGVLDRNQRESVEAAFRRRRDSGRTFNDPNVLSCTPTLELGIDIGDLSAVVLASLPRNSASYAQRVGRAGRRTGNAFLLTIPERRKRDLYYLDRPKDMIAGPITPPGCHLSAVEILRRQYLAHLLDLAARGRLTGAEGRVLPGLPRKAKDVFGPAGYLVDLVEAALAHGETAVTAFLELFPTGVSEQAAADLRTYATAELRGAVEQADRAWAAREDALHSRIRHINEALGELHDADPEEARQKAELEAERRGVGRRLGELREETPGQGALVELGLLPNYALIDAATVLEATLYWPEEKAPGERPIYDSELRSYERPQRLALSELAPGNTFYINRYRHEITGLDIGTASQPGWETWRVCPSCGYVRTEGAESDRGACPRCHSAAIADDGSCLFKVVQPRLVTARDKREDARIRDDRDERDPRFYEIVHAVDIPDESLERGSWRHETQTFGVDFSRSAVIRTINVGPARYDIPAGDEFAGHTVRLNPFHVCTGCGAATADGRPVFDHDTDELSSSAARDPKLKHHRPWCPLRRGKTAGADQLPVLLAHELRTEALRVLLPAVTVLVEEKIHSFRAALRLGVDKQFGGDPQHLEHTLASMPDTGTGERRWFLVLFDALPGGTGYLHRLTDPEVFRATLLKARETLLDCPCKDEEHRRACHRCLYRYTAERHQAKVSRAEALALLESLLFDREGADAWKTTEVASTGLIGLDGQVESDLEVRFLAALRTWSEQSKDAVLDEDSRASGHLRISGSEERLHWRLTAQERKVGTRTDFTFTRVGGPAETVKVYLDGRRNHASRDRNRLAGDAAIRNGLRAEGAVVFQLTWDDLDLFEGRPTRSTPVWPPYEWAAQETAKGAYEELGGNRPDLAGAVFANPMDTLLGYLRDPSSRLWARRANALVSGLTAHPGTALAGSADRRGPLVATLRTALGLSASPPSGDDGPVSLVHVLRSTDGNGLHLVLAVRDAEQQAPAWTVLTCLDDDTAALGTEEHKQRWRAWLYWSNLLQFLPEAGGDGVQLTTGQAGGFPLEVLAVCGGAGELQSSSTSGASSEPSAVPASAAPPEQPSRSSFEEHVVVLLRDRVWDSDYLSEIDPEEETALLDLATRIADRGKQAPTAFGYELGSGRWPADLVWADDAVKVAVLPVPPAEPDGIDGTDRTDDATGDAAGGDAGDAAGGESERRLAAYRAAGWTARTAADWLDHLESLISLLPDAPSTGAPHDVEGSLR